MSPTYFDPTKGVFYATPERSQEALEWKRVGHMEGKSKPLAKLCASPTSCSLIQRIATAALSVKLAGPRLSLATYHRARRRCNHPLSPWIFGAKQVRSSGVRSLSSGGQPQRSHRGVCHVHTSRPRRPCGCRRTGVCAPGAVEGATHAHKVRSGLRVLTATCIINC